MVKGSGFSRSLTNGMAFPFVLALLQFVIQTTFHGNYGYFRDELYYIACSDHLAFGFVDHPPLSIALLWVSRLLLGDSLYALRFLPSLVGAIVVLLSALMARRLGGDKSAQGLAALSVVAAHGLIGRGTSYSMNPFDVLFWTIAGYIVIAVLSEDRPKLWLLFGVVVGLGLMNKYSIGFMVVGLVVGLMLTRQRSHLAGRWFWLGALTASLIFLPHIIWESIHGFPSIEFMQNASRNKNVSLGVVEFFMGQAKDMNVFTFPLWLGGIYIFAMHESGRFRPLAWMFVIVFVTMVMGNAKVYYLSAIFPIFLAAGAVFFEQSVYRKLWAWVRPVHISLIILMAIVILPFAVPVLPVGQFIRYEHLLNLMPQAEERSSLGELPQFYADQFGWEETVDSVAGVYERLTPEEQSQCVIFVRNYGEAAAIDFFGKRHGLPHAVCAHNSYWFWGPGERTGQVAIIFGSNRTLEDNYADLRRSYAYVDFAATTNARYCMPYENGRMIFLCKGMNTTFQMIWPREKFFI